MTKRKSIVLYAVMTAIILVLLTSIGVMALNQRSFSFGLKLNINPAIYTRVEISTTDTQDSNFTTVFNNFQPNTVNSSAVRSQQNNVLLLDLLLSSPAIIYLKISNYTTATDVDDLETYPNGPALNASATVSFSGGSGDLSSYETNPKSGLLNILPYTTGTPDSQILEIQILTMQQVQAQINLSLELQDREYDLEHATSSNGTAIAFDNKSIETNAHTTNGATFTVSTRAGLANLASIVNGSLAIGSDIIAGNITAANDMAGAEIKMKNDILISEWAPIYNGNTLTNVPTASNYTAIGNATNKFNGTFDGNGFKIDGLCINTTADYQGIFGYTNTSSTIQNIGLGENSYIKGNHDVGGIVGYSYYGITTYCYNTGIVSGDGYRVGGVAGKTEFGEMSNCYNTGAITGNSTVGGVVGRNNSITTNCYNTGAVWGLDTVGGITGENYGAISNCYNVGTFSGSVDVGGIVGGRYGTITNCYYLNGATFLLHGGNSTTYTELALLTALNNYVTINPTMALSAWKIIALNNGRPVFVWQDI